MRISDCSSDLCSSDLLFRLQPCVEPVLLAQSPSIAARIGMVDAIADDRGDQQRHQQHQAVCNDQSRFHEGLSAVGGARCARIQGARAAIASSTALSPSALCTARSIGRPPSATSWALRNRSEEHTSELQSLMRNSYAVFCLKKKKNNQ